MKISRISESELCMHVVHQSKQLKSSNVLDKTFKLIYLLEKLLRNICKLQPLFAYM